MNRLDRVSVNMVSMRIGVVSEWQRARGILVRTRIDTLLERGARELEGQMSGVQYRNARARGGGR